MTATYASMDLMWRSEAQRVLTDGSDVESRYGPCREILGTHYVLADPTNNVVTSPGRRFSPWYAAAELLWFFSGTDLIERILAYSPQYGRWAENGRAFGAYGARIFNDAQFKRATDEALAPPPGGLDLPTNQLSAVVEALKKNPDSRQAIITLWNAGDLVHAILGDHSDLPCALSLQFLTRDGALHLIANVRSNDMWLGLPYDVFSFTTLQALVADVLGLKLGAYVHNAGSMHVYAHDADKLDDAIAEPTLDLPAPNYANRFVPKGWRLEPELSEACYLESVARNGTVMPRASWMNVLEAACGKKTLLRDLVVACGIKWGMTTAEDLHSPLLKETADAHRRRDRQGGEDDAVCEAT